LILLLNRLLLGGTSLASGKDARGSINYASVVGMLLYLRHSRPDISFVTHQRACFTHSPKQSHEDALKRIGRYLKGTLNQGLILNPSETLKIECYPDADFAGLWNRDEKQVPYCVRSRTGYVVCLSNCPVLWKSKLQTEIALSTMEAEYVALSASCRDLFPLIDITNELCTALQVKMHPRTQLSWKCRRFRCCPQLVLATCLRVFPRPDTADVSATSCDVGFFFSVSYVMSLRPTCRGNYYKVPYTPCVSDLLYPSSLSQHNHHNCSANFPPAPAAAI